MNILELKKLIWASIWNYKQNFVYAFLWHAYCYSEKHELIFFILHPFLQLCPMILMIKLRFSVPKRSHSQLCILCSYNFHTLNASNYMFLRILCTIIYSGMHHKSDGSKMFSLATVTWLFFRNVCRIPAPFALLLFKNIY